VAALVALLLRVVRQLGGRAGGAQSAALGPGERGVHFGGAAVAQRRQRGLLLPPVPRTRRRWAAVSLAFAGGSRLRAARGPADAGCGGRLSVSGRDLARRARVARPRNSRGRARRASPGAAWRSPWGELASGRMFLRRACDLTRHIERYGPGMDAPVLRGRSRRGGSPSRGRGRGGGGASRCPLSPIYRKPRTGRPSSGWANGQAGATSVRRAPARRYAKAMAVDFALRARRLPIHDAARVRVSRFSEHPNEPGGGRRSAHTPRTREWARGRARAPMARCGEALA
jgi:hypothetical protein